MKIRSLMLFVQLLASLAFAKVLLAESPSLINYQGRVSVSGVSFSGIGQFRFALVSATGAVTEWSNDGTSSTGSQPTTAVSLSVKDGIYSVLLGDTALPNMMSIPASAIADSEVRLRVWFDDGVNGIHLLTPDQRITAVSSVFPAGVGDPGTGTPAISARPSSDAQLTVAHDSVQLDPNYVRISADTIADSWQRRAGGSLHPSARYLHTVVWTGTEMIVWGGSSPSTYLSTGGRYNPATNAWTEVPTTGAPQGRNSHTAVWTGTEMIVWGGAISDSVYVNTGGRYNPTTNAWTSVTTSGAPVARSNHSAIWTGSEMIVWGGSDGLFGSDLNAGGRYDPATDTWTAVSTTGSPGGRSSHNAIWTGKEMIVWGGIVSNFNYLNTGGRYDPVANTWTAVSTIGAPAERGSHTAVWTGSEMIVWGGFGRDLNGGKLLNDGGRYNPAVNSWTALTSTGAPEARGHHTAVWTGTEMVVWGGASATSYLNSGARYNPSTNTWTVMTTANAPTSRFSHTAMWTGSEMLIWGGATINGVCFETGGRYDPAADTWLSFASTSGSPSARSGHTAVWTGSEMIVWGGFDGGYLGDGKRYNPTTNSWTNISATNAPTGRSEHTAVWTGNEMIIWGGWISNYTFFSSGGRYNPTTDVWMTVTTADAPTGRSSHTAVWAGSEMIVWGGGGSTEVDGTGLSNNGGRYDPVSDRWTSVSMTGVPTARASHTAVWTGSEMIVWGGFGITFLNGNMFSKTSDMLNDGGRYNPSTNAWSALTPAGTPIPRATHTAVWTGSEMIVWGGIGKGTTNTGGRYNPFTDSWTAVSTSGAPVPRSSHTAVWTGNSMLIWAGYDGADYVNTGGRYNPTNDSWSSISLIDAPVARRSHTAVWTGSAMLVWGGGDGTSYYDDMWSYVNGDGGTVPVFSLQPLSRSVTVGGSVTLTATAIGLPSPTFQWYKDGVVLSGGTVSSYTFGGVTVDDAGDYSVVAKNQIGSITSNLATLRVGVPPAGFDVVSYLTRYPEVAAIYGPDSNGNGYNPYGAWDYYRNFGIYQGQVFDDLFRVEEYLTLYPDLYAIFGGDLGAALDHWLSTGRIEGKLGRIPSEFSADGYFTRNPDVATAVNNDPLLAWGHYWLYGIYEGRAYDDELRVFEYLAINADLTAAFVEDWRQAALHWMRYGRTEGRLGRLPLTFNVTEYLNRSPDVAAVWGTNPTTVFLHFWLYGIDENRTYDDLFRPVEYLALNPDLAPALGADRRLAFKHWVRYGQTEGRLGKNP